MDDSEMHPLHTYIADRISEMLHERRIVVFYDPREEFRPFIAELARDEEEELPRVHVGAMEAHLAEYEGSFFEVRFRVEPVVSKSQPDPLLIYVPGEERDRQGSVLMELEKGGRAYEPQLKKLARHVLRSAFTEGQIDTFLAADSVAYDDIAELLRQAQKTEEPSMLRTIYDGRTGLDLIAAWLMAPEDDERIESKQARGELYQLINTRLGLALDEEVALHDARDRTHRYLLLGEFRLDLEAEPPASLSQIPAPSTVDHHRRVRVLTEKLREKYPDTYQQVAQQVSREFRLESEKLAAEDLGQIDTFQFEAEVMLAYAGNLVAKENYKAARHVIEAHRDSYWVQHNIVRQAQWEAVRLMAQLGQEVERVRASIKGASRSPDQWFEAYTDDEKWHRLDGAHRVLEDWIANMDEEPVSEQALGKVRRAYEVLLHQMTDKFTSALVEADWEIDNALPQTQIYQKFVHTTTAPTAYILADALRYEMGVELSRQLEAAKEMVVRPALAQLPSVTTVGMAALLPDASKSFSVVEENGDLAASIEGQTLPNHKERRKMLEGEVPRLVDLRLQDVLQYSGKKLRRSIGDAPVILVRSQEIDALGEQGLSHLARQIMGTVIGNIGRAVRKLADAGVASFVVTADHGHQFALEKGQDMKIEAPGGDTVKLNRRCWAGRGGETPGGTVRVQGAELGYDTDLEFVFPKGTAVFKSGGDLTYHHGGISLQELVVPVLRFQMEAESERAKQVGPEVELLNVPEVITNRTFPVSLRVHGDLFVREPIPLRIVIVSGEEQVGEARMAMEATMDHERGLILAEQGTEAMVGLILTRDDVDEVRVVVQDPQSGSVFTQSDLIPVNLSI